MSRYIEADVLLDIFKALKWYASYSIVHGVPAADVVERKHGEWIACQDGKYHCSRCDDVAPKGYRWNYCPNCGADMRGDEDDKR